MLTRDNLAELKSKLLAKEKDLQKQIADTEKTPDFGSDVDDLEEEAQEAEEIGKNLGEGKAFRDRLEDIEHALQKMDDGSYGVCEECNEPIELALLQVDPESRLCKSCKTKLR